MLINFKKFFSGIFSGDIAIDLGTANTIIWVKGEGVVGEQPIIHPGDEFEYTSGTPLKTSSGLMHGSYQMEDFKGRSFEVAIPPFSLDIPDNEKRYN